MTGKSDLDRGANKTNPYNTPTEYGYSLSVSAKDKREKLGHCLFILFLFSCVSLQSAEPRDDCPRVFGVAGRVSPPNLAGTKTAGERVSLVGLWLGERFTRIEEAYGGKVIDALGVGSDATVLLLKQPNETHVIVKAGSRRTQHEFFVLREIRRRYEATGSSPGNIPEVIKSDPGTMSFSMKPISKVHDEHHYVRPRTLLELLNTTPPYFGPGNPERNAEVLAKIQEQVAILHQSGYVHRDLKPSNILLVEEKGKPTQVWLIDFGSSEQLDRRLHPDDPDLPFSNGTVGYVSVNQKFGMPVHYLDDNAPLEQIAKDLNAGHPPEVSFFDF